MALTDFIKNVFGPVTENPVYVSSLPNSDARDREPGEKHVMTRDLCTIELFASKWDRKDRGLFFCVATLAPDARPERPGGSPRSKANVSEISLLHADIDLKSITISIDEVVARVGALPHPPSVVILSGNGVHCYWLLSEGHEADEETVERIERALKQLADLVGGDLAVAEISRLMRLPGTHNTKEGAWSEVTIAVADYDRRHHLDDVEDMLGFMSPIIARKAVERKDAPSRAEVETNPFLAVAARFGFKPSIDVEQRLAVMSYQGVGESSIHQTQLQVSASLLSRGTEVEEVVSILLDATRAAAGDYGSRWNWGREERAIRRMCQDWVRKNPPAAKTAQREQPRNATPDERVRSDDHHVSDSTADGTVIRLADRREKKKREKAAKSGDREDVPVIVAEGVIDSIRRAGQDILLTEGEVFIYAEGVWHVMTPAEQQWMQTLIQEGFEALGQLMKVQSLNACWRRITEHPGLFRRKVEWNVDGLIATPNGMLDPIRGTFGPHRPDAYARRKIGAPYLAGADCPDFKAFVGSLFRDKPASDRAGLIGLVQEWFGAALATPLLSREERKALLLVGPSRTGKTELSRVARLLVGDPVATPSVAEISERFGLGTLYESAAWIRDDAINEGDMLDPQRFKTIVTGEPIDIERKHRDPVRGVELAIPILLTTNALPRTKDRSDAIFNRSLILEMTHEVTEEGAQAARRAFNVPRGQTLSQHLFHREAAGILNWALEGLGRLLERGAYNPPESVRLAVQRFKDDNNPVAEFARTALVRRATGKVARHDLMCAFHGWQREQEGDEARAFGARAFFPRLRAAMPTIGDMTDSAGRRYVTGLVLTDEGLGHWQSHFDGPQLKGGSKGQSIQRHDVNKTWTDEPETHREDTNAPRF